MALKAEMKRIGAARATGKVHPDTEFRCTLLCKCTRDFVEGYGPTAEVARSVADFYWRRGGHKKRDLHTVVIECANGGPQYTKVG